MSSPVGARHRLSGFRLNSECEYDRCELLAVALGDLRRWLRKKWGEKGTKIGKIDNFRDWLLPGNFAGSEGLAINGGRERLGIRQVVLREEAATGADDSHPHVNLIVAPGGGCIRVLLLDSASSDRGRLAAQRDNGVSEPRANRAPKNALACFSVGDKLMRTILSDMSVKRPCRAII
ncbi:hypothetical protein B0H13DRAFT_2368287 [Mycena leptocephala]|nr:hypothetical protein B0H13DRAFT_2368287 [Mycena leptocephala]